MTSKSPVRSCEDVDETALSYAEIKALCAGNPLIAQKMNLDVEVAKLRMIKSDYQSQRFRLEDDITQHYPKKITALSERIAGIEKDIIPYNAEKAKELDIQGGVAGAVSVEAKFSDMTINCITYTEKEPAGKALLEACKTIPAKEEVAIGNYMGFDMSLRFDRYNKNITLTLRGSISYQLELGTDAFGNITRINNGLADLPRKLKETRSSLNDVISQQEAAKAELAKPFALADELTEKEALLTKLNAELNIGPDGIEAQSFEVNAAYDGASAESVNDYDFDSDFDEFDGNSDANASHDEGADTEYGDDDATAYDGSDSPITNLVMGSEAITSSVKPAPNPGVPSFLANVQKSMTEKQAAAMSKVLEEAEI